ncbi:MAG TPA: hypothetical protein VMR25_17650 [Planctomycetaceae bacterium]|nr:hypothetical protein [Planctomycetaceae bacterium]
MASGEWRAASGERRAASGGIKMVADAKAYEMEKAKGDGKTYLALKSIELQKAKIEKWDGRFPTYFLGQSDPQLLLQVPMVDSK